MIVPRTRLLVFFGITSIPVSLLWAVNPGAGPAVGIIVLLMLGIIGLDAKWGLDRRGTVTVSFPDRENMVEFQYSELPFFLEKADESEWVVRIGLAFPRTAEQDPSVFEAKMPAEEHRVRYAWKVGFGRRGSFSFDTCYVEQKSPMGFWDVRYEEDVDLTIRVFPDLQTEEEKLGAMFMNRGTTGVHTHRQIGKGREFEKLRKYVTGDSYRDIYWKQTAKRNRPITKEYQVEQTQEIYVVLDTSRLSGREVRRPKQGKTRSRSASDDRRMEVPDATTILERYIVASQVLCAAAQEQKDHFGLISFDRQVNRYIPPDGGKKHFQSIRNAVFDLETELVNPDFESLFSFLRTRLTKRSLLVLLTNLDDPVLTEEYIHAVDLVNGQHLVLTAMIDQPDIGPLFGDANVEQVEDLYQKLSGHLQWRDLARLKKKLKQIGVSFSLVKNEWLVDELVTHYVNIKKKQAL